MSSYFINLFYLIDLLVNLVENLSYFLWFFVNKVFGRIIIIFILKFLDLIGVFGLE